jgi:ubiquinone biosynthesis protein COQ9
MHTTAEKKTPQDLILDRALELAPDTGWTNELVQQLKDEFGLADFTAHYPNGVIDLLYAFADRADQAMMAALEATDIEKLKIRDRIRLGVRSRLESLTPYHATFKTSIKHLMKPAHAGDLKKISWRTADRLWWAAGDRSTDYNHYSKRILLSGVFASTTLFWLRDKSDNHERSWAYLDRRIDNVMSIGKFLGRFKKTG